MCIFLQTKCDPKKHTVIHHLSHISTPTCFVTEVPPSGSHYNKGI